MDICARGSPSPCAFGFERDWAEDGPVFMMIQDEEEGGDYLVAHVAWRVVKGRGGGGGVVITCNGGNRRLYELTRSAGL